MKTVDREIESIKDRILLELKTEVQELESEHNDKTQGREFRIALESKLNQTQKVKSKIEDIFNSFGH